jgi:hypothetical protein
MKLKDIFNYDNPKYQTLKEPSRIVSGAYSSANKWLDQLKEYIYIEYGMIFLSNVIHANAHIQLERLDIIADLLHERHLEQFYPTTEELDLRAEVKDVDDCFNLIIRILDNVQNALNEFYKQTDTADLKPMSLKIEELMLENSKDYTKFLEMWQMWDNFDGSLTSYDSWVEKITDKD